MKKRIMALSVFLMITIGFGSVLVQAQSDLDWTVVKQIKLENQPVDVAASDDGSLIFVLTPNEIVVYDLPRNQVIKRVPIGGSYDRIKYSAKNNLLVLSSSSSKTLDIIKIDWIQDIDISGRAFRGPADAPVTIAVFDDYQ